MNLFFVANFNPQPNISNKPNQIAFKYKMK
jgi:hypothetical protein